MKTRANSDLRRTDVWVKVTTWENASSPDDYINCLDYRRAITKGTGENVTGIVNWDLEWTTEVLTTSDLESTGM